MIRARYQRILFFFARAILNVLVWDILLARFGLRALARRTRPRRMQRLAQQYRALAVRMGGVMIKVGQFLSSRLDVLPREITDELAGLQDEVAPETFDDIRRELESSLNAPLDSVFSWFEQTPMASASIGQAHRARLDLPDADGQPLSHAVVVKVQRPNIHRIVETDLAALVIVSRWLHRYRPLRKHVNVPALLDELSRSIREEMDYINEGRNAERFAENFKEDAGVLVPLVFWESTTSSVITLEDVQAIKITDYAAIEAAGVDRTQVADRLFNVYLKQILEDQFFHADPHPGNLFVEPLGEAGLPNREWRLVFVDFGMTGEISTDLMLGLREAVIAISTGDAARMVKADRKLHFLLPSADLDLLERAYRRLFESFSGKSTREMMKMHRQEAVSFLRDFRQLIYDMPFQFPEDMILLGRCLSILSGMCSGLDPAFNFWTGVAPFARRMVEMEGGQGIEMVLRELADWLKMAAGLPKKIDRMLDRLEDGKVELRVPGLENKIARLERGQTRMAEAILSGAFLLAGVQLYVANHMELALISGALSGLLLISVLVKR